MPIKNINEIIRQGVIPRRKERDDAVKETKKLRGMLNKDR